MRRNVRVSGGGAAGYTVVELLMAVAVFAIGVSGIIAMQKVTIVANRHAKDLTVATHVAEAWADQLAVDAATWNHPSQRQPGLRDITDTVWLENAVEPTADPAWFLPAYDTLRRFGPAFDVHGKPIDVTSGAADARFCTHLRLSWLQPDTAGNGLIRAEIRVFWLRDDAAPLNANPVCDAGTLPNLVKPDRHHFVHYVTAIKQNTAL